MLTPVISVTKSITTYSATSANRPFEPVLRRNSVIFNPPSKPSKLVLDWYQNALWAGVQQWLVGGPWWNSGNQPWDNSSHGLQAAFGVEKAFMQA